ncbi:hypothetical protein GCM10027447_05010 [Glycomyces halotolerans]
MDSARKYALAAGLLYLVTHVTSVTGRLLYDPVLSDPEYVLGPGADSQVMLGAVLELFLAVAIVGTGVALFPVVKRQNEGIALGYVGLRTLEASAVLLGVAAILGVLTLRQDGGDASLVGPAQALVAFHEWTFLVGPSFVVSVHTVLMAYLMYRSGLVPRAIGVLGLVGGVLIFASTVMVLLGVYPQASAIGAIVAVPVFAWELSFALWLVIKGFRPAALEALEPSAVR